MTRAGLVPDGVGDPEPAEVVDEAGAAHGRHVIGGVAGHARRRGGQVGHAARVAGQVGALHVDQVGHGLQDLVQAGAVGAPRQLRLGAEHGVPVGGLVEAVQQLRRVGAEQVHDRRVELGPAVPAGDRHRGPGAVPPADDLDRPGQMHQPRWEADLLPPQVIGIALAVPLLIPLPDRDADRLVQADLLSELGAQRRVRRHENGHLPGRGHREGGQPPGAGQAAAVRADPPPHQGDHPRGAHVEQLVPVALHADVVAEPLRLLGRVGMAVDVHHQAEVIGGLQLPVAGPEQRGQPQRDHRLAHAVGHRLPEAQIRGVGQRRHQLRDPDAARFRLVSHNGSLRARPRPDRSPASGVPSGRAAGQREQAVQHGTALS